MHPQYAVSSKYIRSSTMICYEIFAYGRLSQSFLHQSPHDAVKPESLTAPKNFSKLSLFDRVLYHTANLSKPLNFDFFFPEWWPSRLILRKWQYGRHSLILGYWVADLRAWPEAAKVVRGGWRPPRLRWMPIGIYDGVMLLPMGQSFIAQDCHAIISTCWLAGLRAWPEALEVVSSGCRSFRLRWMPSRVYARVLLLEQYLRR